MSLRWLLCGPVLLILSACAAAPKRETPPPAAETQVVPPVRTAEVEAATQPGSGSPYPPAQEDLEKRGDYVAGGLYAPHIRDSAPEPIADIDAIPEPEVRNEPRSRMGNRTYSVLGKTYRIRDSAEGYIEQGIASFYGKKFHGRRTSNHEVYDMYALSAAHRSLPLPSYVRVTNLDNGKSVVVRVNDRGPFHAGRVIDLSYAAATKLGFIKQGTARVEVRALTPGDRREGGKPPADAQTPAAAAGADTVASRVVEDRSVPADDFERWMQAQGIRFATGRSGPTTAPPPASSPLPSPAPVAETSAAPGETVLLQLAAFSARDNAERALARLREGGGRGRSPRRSRSRWAHRLASAARAGARRARGGTFRALCRSWFSVGAGCPRMNRRPARPIWIDGPVRMHRHD